MTTATVGSLRAPRVYIAEFRCRSAELKIVRSVSGEKMSGLAAVSTWPVLFRLMIITTLSPTTSEALEFLSAERA